MSMLIIDSTPPLAFYNDDTPPDVDLRWRRLVAVGETRSMLRIDGGETPNGSASIDNGAGDLTEQFTGDLLRTPVRIYDGDVLIFRGSIRRISISNEITLDLEA